MGVDLSFFFVIVRHVRFIRLKFVSQLVRDLISVGEENEAFLIIRVWKPLPNRHNLKTLRGSPKRTISTRGELGLLQMVPELDTRRCVKEEAELRRGWI